MRATRMGGISRFAAAVFSAGLFAIGCGGPQQPPPRRGPEPLCFLPTPRRAGPDGGTAASNPDAGRTVVVRSLRPEQWFGLVVRGYDRTTGRFQTPAQDCTGRAVEWREPRNDVDGGACLEAIDPPEPLGMGRLTDDDLVISRGPQNTRYVWVILQRYSNGEGQGPVAVAEFNDDGVAIRAIGTLRARTRRPRIHVETVTGGRVLVAEGEHCTDPDNAATCQRSVRLLPQRGDRFVNEPIRLEDGTCVGPAWFDYTRTHDRDLPNGWRRHFELNTAMRYNAGVILTHEQVVAQDSDPRQPAIPPRPYRRADADRFIRLTDGRFVTDNTSLWSRVLADDAIVTNRATTDAGPPDVIVPQR